MYRSSGREKISILSSKRDIGDDLRKNRRIYLIVGFTDMHKQINGLAQLAEAKKPKELLSGNYFVFLGKTRRVMKILCRDKTGFCSWTKRLEYSDNFMVPRVRESRRKRVVKAGFSMRQRPMHKSLSGKRIRHS